LTFSVRFLDMATAMAALRGVSRVDKPDFHPVQNCLVDYKEFKLGERPITPCGPVLTPNPGPQRNALEVFQANPPFRAFSGFDKLLSNAMVNISLITRLTVVQLPQSALCTFCARSLQFLTALNVPLAFFLNGFSLIVRTVAVGGDVDHTPVNAQERFHLVLSRVGDVAGCQQVPLTTTVNQIAFAMLVRQQFELPITTHERHVHAPVECPERDKPPFHIELQQTVIVRKRTVLLEHALVRLIQFVAIGYFTEYPHRCLRAQFKLLANRRVQMLMQLEGIKNLRLPGVLTHHVARSVAALKRLFEGAELPFIGQKLNLSGEFHTDQYNTVFYQKKGESAFLPTAKAGGFLRKTDEF